MISLRKFGLSRAQAALLLKTLESDSASFWPGIYDKQATVDILVARDLVKKEDFHTSQEKDSLRQEVHEHALLARDCLPEGWDEAAKHLNICQVKNKEIYRKCYRLTAKGKDLAQSMRDAGLTRDGVFFGD